MGEINRKLSAIQLVSRPTEMFSPASNLADTQPALPRFQHAASVKGRCMASASGSRGLAESFNESGSHTRNVKDFLRTLKARFPHGHSSTVSGSESPNVTSLLSAFLIDAGSLGLGGTVTAIRRRRFAWLTQWSAQRLRRQGGPGWWQ